MRKNNIWNLLVKIFMYIIIIVNVFVLGNITARVVEAEIVPIGTFNPSDPAALEKNPPIEIYGVTCGRADSNQNKCCKNEPLINLNPQQIADQGAELADKILNATGSAQLSSADLSLIDQAIEASSMDNGIVLAKADDTLDKLVNGPAPSQADRQMVVAIVEDGFKHLVDTTKNTGPARLMARQIFTPDKCLIKTRFVKFCFRGIMEFFAGIVDSVPFLTAGLKDAYTQTKFTECEYGVPSSSITDPSCICKNPDGVAAICRKYITSSEAGRCSDCILNKGGFWTGLGCIGTDPASFSQSMIGYGLSIGGSFSLLCIFYAAFVLQTSRGNPEKIKKAKENLRACITGLLLIIFSIFIVRVIGVDLLRIPGFN